MIYYLRERGNSASRACPAHYGQIFLEKVGKIPFSTIVNGVGEGDYYIPITLSKEAISFLNSTLQYDSKKRLSIHKLYNHKFLRKNVKEFNKINLDELKNINIIDNSKIVVNIKNNEIIRDYFGDGI